ncbi:GNAT family N-acetyltransferase [Massilia terrae]|uniref:GNAT family N-acetyltransferase n=1 Tax=Massilia terrae TaxID=1811224 RepID=A0ABT2CUQ1_9BURK|nr:GNAT family N-acetyltransferase [Massilia terrae]MCS0657702.1 GNAT family N-acetyltransferase [Massilia terrae]
MNEIRKLDSKGVDRFLPELADLLRDAVQHGASVGFLPPLGMSEALGYWLEVRAAVADGSRIALVALRSGTLAGTVQLELCRKANGKNRAELQKLLVHSDARRSGIASALLAEAEAQAMALKRGLVYLDTEAGSGAEGFYRACGYTRLGELPDYCCDTTGHWRATAIWFKQLFVPQPLAVAA